MHSIVLVLLVIVFFSWAEEPPVDETPPPRLMQIHTKDSISSILCGQVDPDGGITFISDGLHGSQMKVDIIELDSLLQPIVIDTDPYGYPIYKRGSRSYYTSQIDSITFPLFMPPAVQ